MSYICEECGPRSSNVPKGQRMLTNRIVRQVEYRTYPKVLTGDPAEVKVTEGTETIREIPVCTKHHREDPRITGETKVVVCRQ